MTNFIFVYRKDDDVRWSEVPAHRITEAVTIFKKRITADEMYLVIQTSDADPVYYEADEL